MAIDRSDHVLDHFHADQTILTCCIQAADIDDFLIETRGKPGKVFCSIDSDSKWNRSCDRIAHRPRLMRFINGGSSRMSILTELGAGENLTPKLSGSSQDSHRVTPSGFALDSYYGVYRRLVFGIKCNVNNRRFPKRLVYGTRVWFGGANRDDGPACIVQPLWEEPTFGVAAMRRFPRKSLLGEMYV